MYRGFNLQLNENYFLDRDISKGTKLYLEYNNKIEKNLERFLNSENHLDGSSIQQNWFPQIDADVFISHSHSDQNLAISFADWLWENFELKAFIDSCVWGHATDLLRVIDDRYCLNINSNTYSYEKRNYSTSHVHMMLSTALTMMIDKCECLFFGSVI